MIQSDYLKYIPWPNLSKIQYSTASNGNFETEANKTKSTVPEKN